MKKFAAVAYKVLDKKFGIAKQGDPDFVTEQEFIRIYGPILLNALSKRRQYVSQNLGKAMNGTCVYV